MSRKTTKPKKHPKLKTFKVQQRITAGEATLFDGSIDNGVDIVEWLGPDNARVAPDENNPGNVIHIFDHEDGEEILYDIAFQDDYIIKTSDQTIECFNAELFQDQWETQ